MFIGCICLLFTGIYRSRKGRRECMVNINFKSVGTTKEDGGKGNNTEWICRGLHLC